jgi:hypothetical protein
MAEAWRSFPVLDTVVDVPVVDLAQWVVVLDVAREIDVALLLSDDAKAPMAHPYRSGPCILDTFTVADCRGFADALRFFDDCVFPDRCVIKVSLYCLSGATAGFVTSDSEPLALLICERVLGVTVLINSVVRVGDPVLTGDSRHCSSRIGNASPICSSASSRASIASTESSILVKRLGGWECLAGECFRQVISSWVTLALDFKGERVTIDCMNESSSSPSPAGLPEARSMCTVGLKVGICSLDGLKGLFCDFGGIGPFSPLILESCETQLVN